MCLVIFYWNFSFFFNADTFFYDDDDDDEETERKKLNEMLWLKYWFKRKRKLFWWSMNRFDVHNARKFSKFNSVYENTNVMNNNVYCWFFRCARLMKITKQTKSYISQIEICWFIWFRSLILFIFVLFVLNASSYLSPIKFRSICRQFQMPENTISHATS